MHESTGAIVPLEGLDAESRKAIEESDDWIEIPGEELPHVRAMNRHGRRAWAARQRSEQRARARREDT